MSARIITNKEREQLRAIYDIGADIQKIDREDLQAYVHELENLILS